MAISIRSLIYFNRSCITTYHSSILRLYSLRMSENNPTYKAYSSLVSNRILSKLQNLLGLTATVNEKALNTFSCKEYNMFYKFPYIIPVSLVNKLKKIYTFVVIAGVPVSIGLWTVDIISGGTLNSFFALGGLICIPLYTLGIVFHKLIGFVYLSTDSTTVKVSYLDFWGRRVDSYCLVEDIIPLSDMQENASDLYIKFVQYSSPQVLYLTLRFGHITDKELFIKVFGKID